MSCYSCLLFLPVILALSKALPLSSGVAGGQRRLAGPRVMNHSPNILFIYSDRPRANVRGCVGNDTIVTPNRHRLAVAGTRFLQTWTKRHDLPTGQRLATNSSISNSTPHPRSFLQANVNQNGQTMPMHFNKREMKPQSLAKRTSRIGQ